MHLDLHPLSSEWKMSRWNSGVCLINTPASLPVSYGSLQPPVLWEQKEESLTESDSQCNRILIRLFNDYINSAANHFTYLASDCRAVLWKAGAA